MKVQAPSNQLSSATSVARRAALAESLRNRIAGLALAPGAVVDELALCEEFGLSRPPVRELLRQMAAEGYIELAIHRAPRVTNLGADSIHRFCTAAPLIYSASVQLAVKHASDAQIERLQAILSEYSKAAVANDVQRAIMLSDALHMAIGEMANNVYLMPSLRRILIDHSRLNAIAYSVPGAQQLLDRSVLQMASIVDAIGARDAERASQAVHSHLAHWRQGAGKPSTSAPLQTAQAC